MTNLNQGYCVNYFNAVLEICTISTWADLLLFLSVIILDNDWIRHHPIIYQLRGNKLPKWANCTNLQQPYTHFCFNSFKWSCSITKISLHVPLAVATFVTLYDVRLALTNSNFFATFLTVGQWMAKDITFLHLFF